MSENRLGENLGIENSWKKEPINIDVEKQKELRFNREVAFEEYLHVLGLSLDELQHKKILDVGAFRSQFADHLLEIGADTEVISIDSRDIPPSDVSQGKNKKISRIDFMSLNLKDRLQLSEEPQFDLVLAKNSTPMMLDYQKNGARRELLRNMNEKEITDFAFTEMSQVIDSAVNHLKVGGTAIFYPIFDAKIVEYYDDKRDFRDWRLALDKKLNQLPTDKYQIEIEKVENDIPPPAQRLKITKIA